MLLATTVIVALGLLLFNLPYPWRVIMPMVPPAYRDLAQRWIVDYVRGVAFSPDGTLLVAASPLDGMQVLIVADERFDQAIQRHRWTGLGLVLLLLGVLLATGIPSESARWGAAGPVLDVIILAVGGWVGLVAILGFGRRHLSFPHPFLAYAGEAVLPFYILHQPVIVVIASLIRTWDMGVGAKYLLVATSAFIVIAAVYELTIRRSNVLRFLFGMRGLPRPHPAAQLAGEA